VSRRRADQRTDRLVLLAAVCALLVLLAGCSGQGEQQGEQQADAIEPQPDEAEAAGEADPSDEEEPAGDSTAPLARESVSVYFPSAVGDGLVAERREIFATSTPGDRIKQIINDLIDGPASPGGLRAVPSGTQLRQVFVLDNGTAYLDFNGELADGIRGGSMRELYTVYAIVDSVILNVKQIRRVGLLVNGQPVDSLNGHLDLRHPLTADRSMILRGKA
jgi:spore germination protein GerM